MQKATTELFNAKVSFIEKSYSRVESVLRFINTNQFHNFMKQEDKKIEFSFHYYNLYVHSAHATIKFSVNDNVIFIQIYFSDIRAQSYTNLYLKS